jgi:hypothetical protein
VYSVNGDGDEAVLADVETLDRPHVGFSKPWMGNLD